MNVIDFIHNTQWEDLPENVRKQARRTFMDTLGVVITAQQTELASIVYDFSALNFGGNATKLIADGRPVSMPGAVLAHGMACDAVDMHDGYQLTKGHPGAAIIPTLVAATKDADGNAVSGKEILTSLAVGYEVAIRAGIALHATACDYHTSGAWNSLGCAAIVARRLGLTHEQTRHALGIAEYHGPRSQMMRCIDHPTMVKDGSGWGAMAGVSAALMAKAGFTGAPAITAEADEVAHLWNDIGENWRLPDIYYKQFAVCYWAQPSIRAALDLKSVHNIDPADIMRIQVATFHEATRLDHATPENTDIAQYSLPFPVASALINGGISYPELNGDSLVDPDVLRLSALVEMVEDEHCNETFPSNRLAKVTLTVADGSVYTSDYTGCPWTEFNPPSDQELLDKFAHIVGQVFDAQRTAKVQALAFGIHEVEDVSALLELL